MCAARSPTRRAPPNAIPTPSSSLPSPRRFRRPSSRKRLPPGQRIFGENRVQEAAAKWPALRERHPDLELHLIGPLQSNKVREAVALFDVIETRRPAEDRARSRRGNATHGKAPAPVRAGQHRRGAAKGGHHSGRGRCLRRACAATSSVSPSTGSCAFRRSTRSRRCISRCSPRSPAGSDVKELSMGMSGDFARAPFAFGATYVRVGTAIFGARDAAAHSRDIPSPFGALTSSCGRVAMRVALTGSVLDRCP